MADNRRVCIAQCLSLCDVAHAATVYNSHPGEDN